VKIFSFATEQEMRVIRHRNGGFGGTPARADNSGSRGNNAGKKRGTPTMARKELRVITPSTAAIGGIMASAKNLNTIFGGGEIFIELN
jgi:hypothetical protein